MHFFNVISSALVLALTTSSALAAPAPAPQSSGCRAATESRTFTNGDCPTHIESKGCNAGQYRGKTISAVTTATSSSCTLVITYECCTK
ncbi:uncharacterized protein EKO05_0001003 [Ascochyta rabiei]|uniref:uncharacterized protein n=1 Tax=Didymella rabiei TaxID=5454 RepID=UPI00220F6AC6|nr:uncharacterized protein EKO05_0001003 [Ascochyta rabiei]UPX10338.1 hypothetical protein EKO05_0001003 [Ascochyta rabiei]